jgi:hypothetical protein
VIYVRKHLQILVLLNVTSVHTLGKNLSLVTYVGKLFHRGESLGFTFVYIREKNLSNVTYEKKNVFKEACFALTLEKSRADVIHVGNHFHEVDISINTDKYIQRRNISNVTYLRKNFHLLDL